MALGILGVVSAIASVVGTGAQIIGGIKQAKAAREAAQQQAALAREQARINAENAQLAAEDFEFQADIIQREDEFSAANALANGIYRAQIIDENAAMSLETARLNAVALNYKSEKTVEQMVQEINDIRMSSSEAVASIHYESAIKESDIQFDTAVLVNDILLTTDRTQERLGASAEEDLASAYFNRSQAGSTRAYSQYKANRLRVTNSRSIAANKARIVGGGITFSGSAMDVVYDMQRQGDMSATDILYEANVKANTQDMMSLLNEYSATQKIREVQLEGEIGAYQAGLAETDAERNITNLRDLTKLRAETIEASSIRQTILTQQQRESQAALSRLDAYKSQLAGENALKLGTLESEKALKEAQFDADRLRRDIDDYEIAKDRTFEHADRVAAAYHALGNQEANFALQAGETNRTNAILGTAGAVAGGVGEVAKIITNPNFDK
tara:strand:- start:1062 stop:2390 length:1329 start_codon:yes stop_codon:yes gene_type:complete